jgi:adenylate kinase family enzyme
MPAAKPYRKAAVRVIEIDGVGEMDEVFERINKALQPAT